MLAAVTPKEQEPLGHASVRRPALQSPSSSGARAAAVSPPFRSALLSLADRHESELAELQSLNAQLRQENERLSSRVRQLRLESPPAKAMECSAPWAESVEGGVRGAALQGSLARGRQAQGGWARPRTAGELSRGPASTPLRRAASCEDATEVEVVHLPGEVAFPGPPAPERRIPSPAAPEHRGLLEMRFQEVVSMEAVDADFEMERLKLHDFDGMSDELASLRSEPSSAQEHCEQLLQKFNAKRRIATLLLSETSWMYQCFVSWSKSRKQAQFKKRAPWDPATSSLNNAFRDMSVIDSSRFILPRSSGQCFRGGTVVLPESSGDILRATCGNFDLSRFLISPGSNGRIVWDLLCVVLLAYDVIMIPITVFDPPQDAFLITMDRLSMGFWTGDMVMSCLTGFVEKGMTVMQPRRILMNYLRTWFVLDLLTVGPEWVFEVVGPGENAVGDQSSGKILRAFRMVRVARLLRLAKLQRIMAMLRDRIDSEIMFIVVNITKLLLMLLVVNHVLASVWYGVGTLGIELGLPNWIETDGFLGQSLGYRYTTSLHWSLTQFTPASMSVQPCNVFERTFSITCLVLGLVIFSSFISSITSAVAQLKNLSDNKAQQFWLLRRYLRQHGIDNELFFRILRYADYACRERNVMVTESRLWVLQLLSEELRNEVQYQVSFSCMRCLPLFEEMRTQSVETVHQLVNKAMSQRSLASQDVLFSVGSPAAYAYVMVSGELHYHHSNDLNQVSWLLVEQGDWLCEPALWTPWMHMGAIQAHLESKVVAIEVAAFTQVVTQSKKAHRIAASYSHFYLRWLNRLSSYQLTDVSKGEVMTPLANKFLDDGRRVRSLAQLAEVEPATPV